ncbi:MAG: hypothetical protein WKG00_36945 [Polyangiaceae bacterium]
MRVRAMVWTTAMALAVLASGSAAMAQGSAKKPAAPARAEAAAPAKAAPAKAAAAAPGKAENGYEYRFDDDLMRGDSLGANAPRITVIKRGNRDRLLRPRLHFVPEMQKSVEAM